MRRFYLYRNKTNTKEYSLRLIEYLLRDHLVGSPDDADYVLVSICDISELADIQKAKSYGKPVITGGLVADYPIVNELSDYAWHGEIYDFVDLVKSGVAVNDMPYITTRNNRVLRISERIDWAINPIIRVGRRASYYYVSKGCPVRCKYCYIGNTRKYQHVPKIKYDIALSKVGRNLMPIAAFNPYGVPGGANIGETLLREYAAGKCGRGAKLIRSGVEFVTAELSAGLAKNVTMEHLHEALARSKAENTKFILYFIAGLEPQDAIEDFFARLPIDYDTMPVVNVVFTYIDPQPFTPMHDFDLRQKITDIDVRRVYLVANGRNKRIRVMPLSGPEKSLSRTLLGRCKSLDDYRFVAGLRGLRHEDVLDRCWSYAGERLVGATGINEIISRPRRRITPDYWGGGVSGAADA